jgi:hypothetical protein
MYKTEHGRVTKVHFAKLYPVNGASKSVCDNNQRAAGYGHDARKEKPAARIRVRVGDDVLASRARLATGGRVGSDPLRAIGLAACNEQIDRSRAVVDSCCVRAVYLGDQTGPNSVHRSKRGSNTI